MEADDSVRLYSRVGSWSVYCAKKPNMIMRKVLIVPSHTSGLATMSIEIDLESSTAYTAGCLVSSRMLPSSPRLPSSYACMVISLGRASF